MERRERFKEEKLKILSLLFDTNKEDLARRQRRRTLQWLSGVVIFLVGIVIVLTLLTLFALDQQAIAEDQRNLAQENEQEALRQEQIARINEQNAIEQRTIAERQSTIATARMMAAQGQALYDDTPLVGLAFTLAGWRLVDGLEPAVAEDLGAQVASMAVRGRLGAVGSDIRDVRRWPGNRFFIANHFRRAELRSASDLSLLDSTQRAVHEAPPGPNAGGGYFYRLRYAFGMDPLYEVRRASDFKLIAVSRRVSNQDFIPPDNPRVYVADTGGFSFHINRIEDGASLVPPLFDLEQVIYQPGWPAFALLYRNDDNTGEPIPPPRLFDVERAEAIATFYDDLHDFYFGTEAAASCFIAKGDQGTTLRSMDKPQEALATWTHNSATFVFGRDPDVGYLMAVLPDSIEVRRCSDGSIVDALPLERARYEAVALDQQPAWMVHNARSKRWYRMAVTDGRLAVEPLPDSASPAETMTAMYNGAQPTMQTNAEATRARSAECDDAFEIEETDREQSELLSLEDGTLIYKVDGLVERCVIKLAGAEEYAEIVYDEGDDFYTLLLRMSDGQLLEDVRGTWTYYLPPSLSYIIVGNKDERGQIVRLTEESRDPTSPTMLTERVRDVTTVIAVAAIINFVLALRNRKRVTGLINNVENVQVNTHPAFTVEYRGGNNQEGHEFRIWNKGISVARNVYVQYQGSADFKSPYPTTLIRLFDY